MHTAIRRPRAVLALATMAVVAGTAGLAGAQLSSSAPPEGLAEHGGAQRVEAGKTAAVRDAVQGGQAHNVILLIGDGMGDSEITVARNYAEGAAGHFKGIDELPLTGQYTTYSLDKTTGLPDYVPDSAATGSAWATGTKTYDNAISVDLEGKAQATLLEIAKRNGLKTGDVSTAELQDATPAVQVAHISARSCYGPVATAKTCPEALIENGGPGSITEQLLNTRPDVTLGGGAATFAETATAGEYEGMTLAEQAEERGYDMVGTADELDAVTYANQNKPVLGLFAPGNFPVRYTGPASTVGGAKLTPEKCTPNPDLPATQPSLAAMTSKAIDLLENRNGFFLQVEGASIDKQDHAANACGQIGETVDLDEAVQVALDYAKEQGNTSVFVTADHAHSSQIIEVGSTSPGLSVALTTADGAPMAVNYGTSPAGGSQQHTGSQLRIAGYGPQAGRVVGLTDQTDLFFTISAALGLVDDPEEASSGATLKVVPTTGKTGKKVTIKLRDLDGDRRVRFVVSGPRTSLTKGKPVVGGRSEAAFVPGKPGTYKITAIGQETDTVVRATVKVTSRR